jgi:hypothetical protein
MKVLFTIVCKHRNNTELFYREVEWPRDVPLPRVGENISLGNLFPCEITHVFWEIEAISGDPISVNIYTDFRDVKTTLYEAVEEGFLIEVTPLNQE